MSHAETPTHRRTLRDLLFRRDALYGLRIVSFRVYMHVCVL